jgi:hypothetical protein
MSWDERATRFEKRPIHTGVIWWLWGLLLISVAAVIITVVGFAGNWGQKAVSVVSPENVEKQYSVVIKKWESLTTAADNACMAGAGVDGGPNAPVFVESPAVAYAGVYRNIRTAYNSAQANVFEAGLVGPSGYPKSIPNFPEATGATPDFCSISTQLAALKEASE